MRHLYCLQHWSPFGATCISCKFGHQVAPLTLFTYLVTRWRYLHCLQNWPPGGTTYIRSKFDELVGFLHQLQIWSSGGPACISCKFGHQVGPVALPHCLGLPYWHHKFVLSWYLHQPELHQLSLKSMLYVVSYIKTHRLDPRYSWVQ